MVPYRSTLPSTVRAKANACSCPLRSGKANADADLSQVPNHECETGHGLANDNHQPVRYRTPVAYVCLSGACLPAQMAERIVRTDLGSGHDGGAGGWHSNRRMESIRHQVAVWTCHREVLLLPQHPHQSLHGQRRVSFRPYLESNTPPTDWIFIFCGECLALPAYYLPWHTLARS